MGLGILSNFREGKPLFGSATARAPKSYQLKDFIGDSNGADDLTTSSVSLLHDGDSITLINPFEGTVAHFEVKTRTQISQKLFGHETTHKTEVKDNKFDLSPGSSKTFTVDEGAVAAVFKTGYFVNQDIYVTLLSVTSTTPEGGTETSYVGAGQNLFGFDVQKKINQFQNQKFMKRLRGGSSYMGLGTRPRLLSLARPPTGGSGRAGGGYGSPEGPSDSAHVGIVGRFRAY